MAPVMTTPAQERSSGVLGLLTRGRERHREVPPTRSVPTVSDLLGGPVPRIRTEPIVVPPEDVEVVLDPEWLADLHDPSLVISPDYVGPDRRLTDRHPVDRPPGPGHARTHGSGRRLAWIATLALLAVLSIAVTVVPAAPATVPGRLTPAHRLAPTSATRVHRLPRAGRSAAQAARIDAARQRALVRRQAKDAATPGATPMASAAVAARMSARAQAKAQAQAAAAQRRADRQTTKAQAQAAAAQRRADRQATRAAVQATIHAGVHGPDGGPPATPAGS